jgi:CRISPR/Cas system-associated endoribonuclease Cas2
MLQCFWLMTGLWVTKMIYLNGVEMNSVKLIKKTFKKLAKNYRNFIINLDIKKNIDSSVIYSILIKIIKLIKFTINQRKFDWVQYSVFTNVGDFLFIIKYLINKI